jgi:hypothetical protein
MSWEIRVNGPTAVLNELAHQFHDDPSIVLEAEGALLRSSVLDRLTDNRAVQVEAERIVRSLSSITRLLLQDRGALRVANVTQVRWDGSRHYFLHAEPGVYKIHGGIASMTVTRSDGTVQGHCASDPAPKWLDKAVSDPSVERALRLRDHDELSWSDWYRLFEAVEAGVGGEDVIIRAGWASKSQLRRFKHSANSVAVAGDGARHGVELSQPPSNPMSLEESRSFVDGLLTSWLRDGAA